MVESLSEKERCGLGIARTCIKAVKQQLAFAAEASTRFRELSELVISGSTNGERIAAASGRSRLTRGVVVGLLPAVNRIEDSISASDYMLTRSGFEDLFREIQCGLCAFSVIRGSAILDGSSDAIAKLAIAPVEEISVYLSRAYLIINDAPGILSKEKINESPEG